MAVFTEHAWSWFWWSRKAPTPPPQSSHRSASAPTVSLVTAASGPGVEARTYLMQQPITHTHTHPRCGSKYLPEATTNHTHIHTSICRYWLTISSSAASGSRPNTWPVQLQNYGYLCSCKASWYQIIHHEEEKRNHFSFMNKSVNTRCGSAYLPEATTNHTHTHTYTHLLTYSAS